MASIAASVVVVITLVLVLVQAGDEPEDGPAPSTTIPDTSPLAVGGAPPRPVDVRVQRTEGGGQVVTWDVPSPQEGDAYQVFFTAGPGDLAGKATTSDERELRVDTDRRVCVTVETIRQGRVSPASTEVCSP